MLLLNARQWVGKRSLDLRVQIKKKGEVGPSIRCNASHSLAPGSFIQEGANFGCKTGCHGRLKKVSCHREAEAGSEHEAIKGRERGALLDVNEVAGDNQPTWLRCLISREGSRVSVTVKREGGAA